MTEPAWDEFPDFARHEFECHCGCGGADMDPSFMRCLQRLRSHLQIPLIVTSGFRCPEYNAEVSDTGRDGPHTYGKASDLKISGADCFRLTAAAPDLGFTGLGFKQHGDHDGRFVHLDTMQGENGWPRPTIWTGYR
jgi:uncharacterized protein YcbK (DUF882 family)